MTSVFDDALAALHDDPNLSLAATFRRGGGGPGVSLRVTRDVVANDFDTLGQRVQGRSDAVRIRTADASAVTKDDSLDILDDDGAAIERLVVISATLDREGLTWTAEVRRQ